MNCDNCGRELACPAVWCNCGRDFRNNDARTKKLVADRCLTPQEFREALLRFRTRAFRWYDEYALVRKYRNVVEGAVALFFFFLFAALHIRQWDGAVLVPRDVFSVFILVAWFGSAQILISSFSSYDLGTWRWMPEPVLALSLLSGVALAYAALRQFPFEPPGAVKVGVPVMFGIIAAVFFYFCYRKSELRYAQTGAYAATKESRVRPARPARESPREAQQDGAAAADMPEADEAHWYHAVVALMLPYVALPWGIVNLVRGKRRSGLMLVIVPLVLFAVLAVTILIISSKGGFDGPVGR